MKNEGGYRKRTYGRSKSDKTLRLVEKEANSDIIEALKWLKLRLINSKKDGETVLNVEEYDLLILDA